MSECGWSRYRSGIRGYMKSVVLDLLKRYLQVEIQFQHGDQNKLSMSTFISPPQVVCRISRLGALVLSRSSLRQVCYQLAGAAQTGHEPRAGLHLLSRPGVQEEHPRHDAHRKASRPPRIRDADLSPNALVTDTVCTV